VVSVADGTEAKSIDAGSPIAASVVVVGMRAFFGTFENAFICADLETAATVWEYTEGDDAFFSTPAVGEDRVIIGCWDSRVHCVDRETGKRIWTFAAGGEVNSSPVIAGDKVLVGSDDGFFYVLALADGKKLWSYDLGGAVIASPAISGDTVVIGSDGGAVFAFRAKGKGGRIIAPLDAGEGSR
jgi:outer membrane protein assembly factor BamB